jgi:hypothetical protein
MFDFIKESLNIEIGDVVRIEDVCEKIGAIFGGEEGRRKGKAIDKATKNITIRIGKDKDDDDE